MMAYLPNTEETNEEVAWEAVGEHLGDGKDVGRQGALQHG